MSTNIKYDWSKLPDPQQQHLPVGANVVITKVGIRKFETPVDFKRRDNTIFREKGIFSAYVKLRESVKGINMSRIPIVIQEGTFNKSINHVSLCEISKQLIEKLETESSYLKLRIDFPMKQYSLRSKDSLGKKNYGWMYYPTEIEVRSDKIGVSHTWITIDFQYSSACPCSFIMSEDYRIKTGNPAIPHSQRSVVKTTIEVESESDYCVEDLIDHHRKAISTEVLGSIVKREDELQFAINNAQQPKFVEDAVRLLYEVLNVDFKIKDFVIVASHFEALHPHQVTAIICKGIEGGLR